jgi:glycerophosphoryl diester phosphodiesterase
MLRLSCAIAVVSQLLGLPLSLTAVEIIAHRGASYDAPENTLASVKLAWVQGADAAEVDLWLSKDDQVVVMHDANSKRIGGRDRAIADQTWAELQELDVGTWKDPQYVGERIPTLESVLESTPAGKKVVLEIKAGPEILPALGKVIKASPLYPRQLIIICFNVEVLKQSKPMFPEVEQYLLSGYKRSTKTGQLPKLEDLVAQAKESKLDGLNLNAGWPMDEAFVKSVKAEGLKLLAWTVNDVEAARRLVAAGLDGITTDRPAYLREEVLKK